MEYEEDMVENAIRRIIRNAPWHHVKIEGNPSERWFVLRDAHLARVFRILHVTSWLDVNQTNG